MWGQEERRNQGPRLSGVAGGLEGFYLGHMLPMGQQLLPCLPSILYNVKLNAKSSASTSKERLEGIMPEIMTPVLISTLGWEVRCFEMQAQMGGAQNLGLQPPECSNYISFEIKTQCVPPPHACLTLTGHGFLNTRIFGT